MIVQVSPKQVIPFSKNSQHALHVLDFNTEMLGLMSSCIRVFAEVSCRKLVAALTWSPYKEESQKWHFMCSTNKAMV